MEVEHLWLFTDRVNISDANSTAGLIFGRRVHYACYTGSKVEGWSWDGRGKGGGGRGGGQRGGREEGDVEEDEGEEINGGTCRGFGRGWWEWRGQRPNRLFHFKGSSSRTPVISPLG